jgi:hypothetical protein
MGAEQQTKERRIPLRSYFHANTTLPFASLAAEANAREAKKLKENCRKQRHKRQHPMSTSKTYAYPRLLGVCVKCWVEFHTASIANNNKNNKNNNNNNNSNGFRVEWHPTPHANDAIEAARDKQAVAVGMAEAPNAVTIRW